jgi:hypothetical protein
VGSSPTRPTSHFLISNLGFVDRSYIRRTIKPTLENMKVCKVRGPVLDMFYVRLRNAGPGMHWLAVYRVPNVPTLTVDPANLRPRWRQLADAVQDAGPLPGAPLPSMAESRALQRIRVSAL